MRLGRSFSFAFAMLASGTAFAGTPGWSISESSGHVSVVSTGLIKAAVRGGAVATGDIINTGRNGRAVLVRGEEYLVVSPNTRIRVADPAKTGGMTQIVEYFGNVIYKIKKMTMPHFAVETPFLAAVVKGTTFSVTVTDKGASVQVTEGRVEVATRDGGASFMVLPGDIGSVSANAPGVLNMQGRENRSIMSPTPAAAAVAVTASVTVDPPAPPTPMSSSVATAVSEGAVDLAAMSDGMVMGDSSMKAMTSMMKMASMEMPAPTPAPAAETGTSVVTANSVVVVEGAPGAVPPVPADVAESGDQPAPVVAQPAVVVAGPAVPAPPVVVAAAPTPAPAPVATPVEPAVMPTPAPPVVVAVAPTPAPAPVEPVVAPTPAPPVVVAVAPSPAPAPVEPAVTPTPAPPPNMVAVAPTPAPAPTVTPIQVAILSPLPAPAPITPAITNGSDVNNASNNTAWNNNSPQPNSGRNGNNGQVGDLDFDDD